jgi:hypothetical protein
MSIPKYKKQYQLMLENNKEVLDELKFAFNAYQINPVSNKDRFREVQMRALRTVRKNENALCAKTENTQYSGYSTNLAEKFWEEVRRDYPEIDLAVD